mmetsp:Transcript_9470/g.16491  ORF Transcript_9470/g.16491 Transcript_9470/m.16491 type:complete len:341 (-) Transcript_9470:198-1220(-)
MQHSVYDLLTKDTADAAESLAATMQKERTHYRCRGYIHTSSSPLSLNHRSNASLPHCCEPLITESDRNKMVDWCYGVVDQCRFDRETVAMTMDLLDRFLSIQSSISQEALRSREIFQLVAMAALFVSIKVNEKVAINSDFFAELSQGIYSSEDIEKMELAILTGLSWRIYAPTSIRTAYDLLSLLVPHAPQVAETTWSYLVDEVRFQTEHAVRDYSFALRRTSTIALASIFNAVDRVGRDARRAILRALLFVLNESFDSPAELLEARNRLRMLVESDEIATQDGAAEDYDDNTILSNGTMGEVEGCSLVSVSEDSFDADARMITGRRSAVNVNCPTVLVL